MRGSCWKSSSDLHERVTGDEMPDQTLPLTVSSPTAASRVERGEVKEPPRAPEMPIPRERIRKFVDQLDFYVAKYEEAVGASEQCSKFHRVIEALSQVKATPTWVIMSGLCSSAYQDLRKAYQGDISGWQDSIPDSPSFKEPVRKYKDRLGLVGQAIATLPSKVSSGDQDAIIGTLSQCSTEMHEESQNIAGTLLSRIRALVQELDEELKKQSGAAM